MTYHPQKFDIDRIKRGIDPSDFYLREQSLYQYGQRSGPWVVAGLCPFHADTSPGSFKVNLQSGAFKCWSCGTWGGDIVSFRQLRDDLNFMEALSTLSREWGVG